MAINIRKSMWVIAQFSLLLILYTQFSFKIISKIYGTIPFISTEKESESNIEETIRFATGLPPTDPKTGEYIFDLMEFKHTGNEYLISNFDIYDKCINNQIVSKSNTPIHLPIITYRCGNEKCFEIINWIKSFLLFGNYKNNSNIIIDLYVYLDNHKCYKLLISQYKNTPYNDLEWIDLHIIYDTNLSNSSQPFHFMKEIQFKCVLKKLSLTAQFPVLNNILTDYETKTDNKYIEYSQFPIFNQSVLPVVLVFDTDIIVTKSIQEIFCMALHIYKQKYLMAMGMHKHLEYYLTSNASMYRINIVNVAKGWYRAKYMGINYNFNNYHSVSGLNGGIIFYNLLKAKQIYFERYIKQMLNSHLLLKRKEFKLTLGEQDIWNYYFAKHNHAKYLKILSCDWNTDDCNLCLYYQKNKIIHGISGYFGVKHNGYNYSNLLYNNDTKTIYELVKQFGQPPGVRNIYNNNTMKWELRVKQRYFKIVDENMINGTANDNWDLEYSPIR